MGNMVEKSVVREKLVAFYRKNNKKAQAIREHIEEVKKICDAHDEACRAYAYSREFGEWMGKIDALYDVCNDIYELLLDEDFAE